MSRKFLNRCSVFCLIVASALVSESIAFAERPAAPDLLPEKTLALVRFPDTQELVTRFRETSMGRMLRDEQMQPIAQKLYGNAVEAYGRIQENIGLPLDRILAIPQGEMFFAVVAMPEGPPALVLLIEVKDQLASATKLLERGMEEIEKQGATKSMEAVGDTKLTIHVPANNRPSAIVSFEKEGAIVLTTSVELAKQMLAFWNGTAEKDVNKFSTNRKFTTIMSRCQGARDERPQFTWYVDPIELVKITSRGNLAAQTGLAILPALGLDGLHGIGGSATLVTGEFDSISHMHLLLESPRSGVIKALAMDVGDSSPEPWVPNDAPTYGSLYWDLPTTMTEVAKLVNNFQGEGAFASQIQKRFSEPLGVDFEKDLLAAFDRRLIYLTWIEKPVRLNSQSQLVALRLKDANAFRGTLDKILEKFQDRFEKKAFGGVAYHRFLIPEGGGLAARRQNRNGELQLELRQPEPCVCLLGDYLIISDSANLLQHCIATQSDPEKSLAASVDFKLMASKMSRQTSGVKAGGIVFNRPEEGLRMLYDLANSDDVRKNLASRAERNDFFRTLNTTMTDHPLPPFSVIAKYFAPAGAILTNEETGFHYTAFSLRRK